MPDANENPHYFDFDLDRGIRQQVVEKLESSPLLALEKNIATIPAAILLQNLTVGYSNSVARL